MQCIAYQRLVNTGSSLNKPFKVMTHTILSCQVQIMNGLLFRHVFSIEAKPLSQYFVIVQRIMCTILSPLFNIYSETVSYDSFEWLLFHQKPMPTLLYHKKLLLHYYTELIDDDMNMNSFVQFLHFTFSFRHRSGLHVLYNL